MEHSHDLAIDVAEHVIRRLLHRTRFASISTAQQQWEKAPERNRVYDPKVPWLRTLLYVGSSPRYSVEIAASPEIAVLEVWLNKEDVTPGPDTGETRLASTQFLFNQHPFSHLRLLYFMATGTPPRDETTEEMYLTLMNL